MLKDFGGFIESAVPGRFIDALPEKIIVGSKTSPRRGNGERVIHRRDVKVLNILVVAPA